MSVADISLCVASIRTLRRPLRFDAHFIQAGYTAGMRTARRAFSESTGALRTPAGAVRSGAIAGSGSHFFGFPRSHEISIFITVSHVQFKALVNVE